MRGHYRGDGGISFSVTCGDASEPLTHFLAREFTQRVPKTPLALPPTMLQPFLQPPAFQITPDEVTGASRLFYPSNRLPSL